MARRPGGIFKALYEPMNSPVFSRACLCGIKATRTLALRLVELSLEQRVSFRWSGFTISYAVSVHSAIGSPKPELRHVTLGIMILASITHQLRVRSKIP